MNREPWTDCWTAAFSSGKFRLWKRTFSRRSQKHHRRNRPRKAGTAAGRTQQKRNSPQKKEGQGRRVKVDTGKLMALHNAGWSNIKIGQELGISEFTVRKYLKQMKEEKDAAVE